jgi:hypothetical protein
LRSTDRIIADIVSSFDVNLEKQEVIVKPEGDATYDTVYEIIKKTGKTVRLQSVARPVCREIDGLCGRFGQARPSECNLSLLNIFASLMARKRIDLSG